MRQTRRQCAATRGHTSPQECFDVTIAAPIDMTYIVASVRWTIRGTSAAT